MKIASISFCIATNASKPDKTNLLINSIRSLSGIDSLDFSIKVAGDINFLRKTDGLKLIDCASDSHGGMLSKLRYILCEGLESDVVVFIDDDFLFPDNWLSKLINYSKKKEWSILGNKILLPNGDRFWDRCTFKPHTMVDYDHPEDDPFLYQTGGFWVMSKPTYSLLKWDPSIPINADKKGMDYNEDIDMSLRARKLGFNISFDEDNLVWHNDESYFQSGYVVLKRNINSMAQYVYARDFLSTSLKLNNGKK